MEEVALHLTKENRTEWERLLRLLQHPTPRVFWVTCDTDLVWLRIIPALKEALPDYEHLEVRLDGNAPSLYHSIAALPIHTEKSMVHILGVTAAVGNGIFLRNLNLEREQLFRKSPGHIVIWGSQAAANIIGTRAADWWSWMAFIFPFHTPKELLTARQKGFEEQVTLGTRVLDIESKEASDRIRHLRNEWDDFLQSAGDAPKSVNAANELADIGLALASEYEGAGRYPEAIAVLERADSWSSDLLPESKQVSIWNNLATALHRAGFFERAEQLLIQALQVVEKGQGAEHPVFVAILSNLALLLSDTNRMSEAEPLMRRALEIDETSFGHDHPSVAIDLNNLAQLLAATNRMTEAVPLMRRALEIYIKSHGDVHPKSQLILKNYSMLLSRMGTSDADIRLQIDGI